MEIHCRTRERILSLREVVCEFCEREFKASETNPHLKDCEEFPIPCPNGCPREEEQRELKRRDIPVLLGNHCPLQEVQCAYWTMDVEMRVTETHEGEFLHIHFKLSVTMMQDEQMNRRYKTKRRLSLILLRSVMES